MARSWNEVLGLRSAQLLLAAALVSLGPGAAEACGQTSDCTIGDRSYRIALPEGRDASQPIGAIIFIHGYRGQAGGVMRNGSLTALVDELGVALIAAQAAGPEWNIPGIPSVDAREGVDELAYFDELVEDAASRFKVDRSRIMVAGFSSGAMMTWHLACYRGNAFAGFVPMSGTFWAPIPRNCPTGPVNLIHYHGRDDTVVPLGGRPIKEAHQGDVFDAFEMLVTTGGYVSGGNETTSELDCARHRNADGKRAELCFFAGKHELKPGHIARAWKAFGLDKSG